MESYSASRRWRHYSSLRRNCIHSEVLFRAREQFELMKLLKTYTLIPLQNSSAGRLRLPMFEVKPEGLNLFFKIFH